MRPPISIFLAIAIALAGCAESASGRSQNPTPTDEDAGGEDTSGQADADPDPVEDVGEEDASEGCEPGTTRCLDPNTNLLCENDGIRESAFTCPPETRCQDGVCNPIVCEPGEPVCEGNDVVSCVDDGTREVRSPCPDDSTCQEGACSGRSCEPGITRCLDARTALLCSDDGLSEIPVPCPGQGLCRDGECIAVICDPDTTRCADEQTILTCIDEGTREEASLCDLETVCRDGECAEIVCSPRTTRCRDALTLLTCDLDGTRELASTCPDDTICRTDRCEALLCEQGSTRCEDLRTVLTCIEEGTDESSSTCAEGSICEEGRCVPGCIPDTPRCLLDDVQICQEDRRTWLTEESCDPEEGFNCIEGICAFSCEALIGKAQYLGCNFWGADTINSNNARSPFAFVVGNVSDVQAANVRVESAGGEVLLEEVVDPLRTAVLTLSVEERTRNITTTGITDFGMRIVTDVPLTAYQMNPYIIRDNQEGYIASSVDTSLLLPDGGLGTSYIVAAWQHWFLVPSFVSIISAEDDNTITVIPTVNIRARGEVPALRREEPTEFLLNSGEILTLLTHEVDQDLTGSEITSTGKIAVISGSDCAQIPIGCPYCDHIEESLYPVDTWGTEYFAVPYARIQNSYDHWRVIASEDDTTLTFDPPTFDPPVLNKGGFFEFQHNAPFHLSSDNPVMLAQYMRGSTCNSIGDGDPSLSLPVSLQQYRRDYIFLVPEVQRTNRIQIIGPADTVFSLDRATLTLTDGEPIGDSGFNYLDMAVETGRHRIVSDQPITVQLYGWDNVISYAHPAGLDLGIGN